jgi:hypothetical protein
LARIEFDEWAVSREIIHNINTREHNVKDPRLGPLPDTWEEVEAKRTRDDPYHFVRFKNKSTGDLINHDPRLSIEALKARGVNVELFTLI